MESIKRLKRYVQSSVKLHTMHKIFEITDEIEREISERYMLLPVDADGVPIRVDDVLECDANGYKGTFTAFAVGNNTVVGNHEIEWIRDNPSKWFHVASFCRHVKPRTAENLLIEFYNEFAKVNGGDDGVLARYVDELRDLLGGDAE